MEIRNFHYTEFINYHEKHWIGQLSVNSGYAKYDFIIKNGEIHFDIHYNKSRMSKSETKELFRLALKDQEIMESLDYIKLVTKGIEEIKYLEDKETLPIEVINYYYYDNSEDYVFSFKESDIVFIYHYDLEESEISSMAFSKERYFDENKSKQMPSIMYFEHLYSDEFNQRLIEQLKIHPKVRIRRMFRED